MTDLGPLNSNVIVKTEIKEFNKRFCSRPQYGSFPQGCRIMKRKFFFQDDKVFVPYLEKIFSTRKFWFKYEQCLDIHSIDRFGVKSIKISKKLIPLYLDNDIIIMDRRSQRKLYVLHNFRSVHSCPLICEFEQYVCPPKEYEEIPKSNAIIFEDSELFD